MIPVVRLRRAANVGEIGAEEEAKLDEHRAAKGKDPFLATLAVHAERAAVGVEVANLDTGQLASADAEEELEIWEITDLAKSLRAPRQEG